MNILQVFIYIYSIELRKRSFFLILSSDKYFSNILWCQWATGSSCEHMFNVLVIYLKKKEKTALEQDQVLKGNQQHEQPVTRLAAKRKAFFLWFFFHFGNKELKITWKYPTSSST